MRPQLHNFALRVIRERTGYKQAEFAQKIGISPQYFSNIENGRRQPPPGVLRRIAAELGITIKDITYTAEIVTIANDAEEEVEAGA